MVPAALAGQRLDRVVSMATGLPRARVHALVAGGAVRVDGRTEGRPALKLREGQGLDVDLPEAVDSDPRAERTVEFSVVHEDEWLLVVDKPAGLVVHPGAGHREGTLVNGLLARYPGLAGVGDPHRPGIVHRLDRGTSGLMLVARNREAFEQLSTMMAARRVERRYLALVRGLLADARGVVDAPVGRSSRQPTRMAVSASGRPARTAYEVRARYPAQDLTLVECRLESGRTHQIRVHLAAIGHPVVGDSQYGGRAGEPVLDRPFLHAHFLGFDHPGGAGRLELSAALPPELGEVLDGLALKDPAVGV